VQPVAYPLMELRPGLRRDVFGRGRFAHPHDVLQYAPRHFKGCAARNRRFRPGLTHEPPFCVRPLVKVGRSADTAELLRPLQFRSWTIPA
jgi:hypothetical protein